jgi:hypothetical protein
MKNVLALMCLIILGLCGRVSAADPTDKDQAAAAIRNVLLQKQQDGLKYAHIVIDNEAIASVHLHGFQYLRALKKIDLKGCPDKFDSAWSDYLAAWQQKLDKEHAKEETADAISLWKGQFDDLPATVRLIEAYDTKDAWEHCESVASEYGVDASKVNFR